MRINLILKTVNLNINNLNLNFKINNLRPDNLKWDILNQLFIMFKEAG